MSNRDREREKNNRLKDWRRNNQKEVREAIITTQQSITQNRWRGFNTIFNAPIAYQVFQLVEDEVVIIVAQIDVEEVNGSTSDGIRQSTQTGSPNVDHEYKISIEKLNTLLLITLKTTINAFGTIDQVTKEGWPRISRWQTNGNQ